MVDVVPPEIEGYHQKEGASGRGRCDRRQRRFTLKICGAPITFYSN